MQLKTSRVILGVAGKNGSGKDTFCDYIEERFSFTKLVFSSLLKEALAVFINQIGREDFSWLSTNLRNRYGEGILAYGMKKKIVKNRKCNLVISGVRDLGELKMIKEHSNAFLVYLDVDQKKRWERISIRKEKSDDLASFEEFKSVKEKLPSEQYLEDLKRRADFMIDNNGSLVALQKKADDLVKKILEK